MIVSKILFIPQRKICNLLPGICIGKCCKKHNDQNILYTVAYFSVLPGILNDLHPFQ